MNNTEEKMNRIVLVLKKYFESDDFGNHNPEFETDFSAQDAIDEIHEIVGDYKATNVKV